MIHISKYLQLWRHTLCGIQNNDVKVVLTKDIGHLAVKKRGDLCPNCVSLHVVEPESEVGRLRKVRGHIQV